MSIASTLTLHHPQTWIHEKKMARPPIFAVLIRPYAFIQTTPSSSPEKCFSSILNEGDDSKPSEHFGSHWYILGADHRDFFDCSPTRSKSNHPFHQIITDEFDSKYKKMKMNKYNTQLEIQQIQSNSISNIKRSNTIKEV